ncbi:hypothetical protein [Streptomyces klenkii]|uniref:hypothetical protein n=1 Tax=Streptomyces klenkii TaxID=1420899 RepID=UPI003422046A
MTQEGVPVDPETVEPIGSEAAETDLAGEQFDVEIVPGADISPYPQVNKDIINDCTVIVSKIDYADLWGPPKSNVKTYQSVRLDRQSPPPDFQNVQVQINNRPAPSTMAGILVDHSLAEKYLKPGQKEFVQRKARDAMLRSRDTKKMMTVRRKKS